MKYNLIVKNSFFTLLSVICRIFLAFFSATLLVKALGIDAFGVLTALGASGFLINIINGGITNSVSRHMAFAVGQKDFSHLNEVVSSTIALFLVVASLVLGLGFFAKPFVLGVLQYPPEMAGDLAIIYFFVLLTVSINTIFSLPDSIWNAHQNMLTVSAFQITQNILHLVLLLHIVSLVTPSVADYVVGNFAIVLVIGIVKFFYVLRHYSYLRPRKELVNKGDLLHIWGYAKWSLLSMLVVQLKNNASVFVINVTHGPVANAGMSLATRANGVVTSFTEAMRLVLQPAMTVAHAQKDPESLSHLVSMACRYMSLIALLPSLPLIIEAPFLLKIWVGEVPPNTDLFLRLISGAAILSMTIGGYGLGMNALNKIGEIIRFSSFWHIAFFGLGFVMLYCFHLSPWWLPLTSLMAFMFLLPLYPLIYGRRLGFPFRLWARTVFLPFLLTLSVAAGLGLLAQRSLDEGIIRLVVTSCMTSLGLLVMAWGLIFNKEEKNKTVCFLQKLKTR